MISCAPRLKASSPRPNSKGVGNGLAILTPFYVREIWRLYEEKHWGYRRIANDLNKPLGAVEHVLRGRSWRHLMPEKYQQIGFVVNDRGKYAKMFFAEDPNVYVVIRDGVASSPQSDRTQRLRQDWRRLSIATLRAIYKRIIEGS